MSKAESCNICGKEIDNNVPLAQDCGGDCWGCISEIEADGIGVDVETYRADPAGEMERYLKRWREGQGDVS